MPDDRPVPSISQQYEMGMAALSTGDVNGLARILTDPAAATPEDQKTVAERLGFKNGFLKWAVDVAADPSIWLAAFMSRKFPTQAWLKGTIPDRFVGQVNGGGNDFSGISLLSRPIESWFRGTTIPKLVSLSMHRQAEVLKSAEPMWKMMERPNWKQEMPVVSLLMEGGNPAGATPELQGLAQQLKGHMDEIWYKFASQTSKISGGLDQGTKAQVVDWAPDEAPRYLRDYLPHIPLTGNESTFAVSGREALERLGGRGNRAMAQALSLKGEEVGKIWNQRGIDGLQSTFANWQRWASTVGPEVYNPHLIQRVRQDIQLATPEGHDLFFTDLNLVLQKYVASMAKTYSINAPLKPFEQALASVEHEDGSREYPTTEPVMVQIINRGLEGTGAQFVRKQIAGTDKFIEQVVPGTASLPRMKVLESLTRAVKGGMSEDQLYFGQLYNSIFGKIDQLKGVLGRNGEAQLTDAVSTIARQRDYRKKVDGLANYFYVSTLGLNFGSAFRNLLQPVFTTVPAIGLGPTLAGLREYVPRVQAFAHDVATELRSVSPELKGLPRMQEAARRSFAKHFGELTEQRLDLDPRLFDISPEVLQRNVSPDGKWIDKDSMFKFLMAPFTTAEIGNRAISFFGAKDALRHAIKTGEYPLPRMPDGSPIAPADVEHLLDFEAGNVTAATQLRPGPGSRTLVQSLLPAPLRQFTSFPIRLANFFADSTVRGATTGAQLDQMSALSKVMTLNGRNLGTLARTYLYSNIAVKGMRDVLGVDIADSVGLTLPFNPAPVEQPFAPFPFPPGLQAMYGVVTAAATRDIDKLQPLTLPNGMKIPIPKTLFPAGVGLNRLFRTVHQFRPDMGGFVDDDERLIYRGSTKDAILSALGIPLDKVRREREQMSRLDAVKGTDRQLQRQMLQAMSRYDFDQADAVKAQHRQLFPDALPLSVSSQQVDTYQANQRKTRVERMLDSMPNRLNFLDNPGMYDYDSDMVQPLAPSGLSPFALQAG